MFSRWLSSIRAKLTAAILVVVLLPLIGTGLYGNWITSRIIQERALEAARNDLLLHAQQIRGFLDSVQRDLVYLENLHSLQEYLEALENEHSLAADAIRQQVMQDFLIFSLTHPMYYQVRFLDKRGMEVVRVDYDGRASRVVPNEELQDKSHRYYFIETIQRPAGTVYISPLDLNREHGAIEVPYKPVIRYAMPVYHDNVLTGMVILNVYARYFLDLLALSQDGTPMIYLADSQGYYLLHNDPAKRWGGPRDRNTGEGVRRDYPAQADAILSGERGAVFTRNKVVVYEPFYPAPQEYPDYFWVLMRVEPTRTLFASIWEFRIAAASILLAAILISSLMAFYLSRMLTEPVRQLHRAVEDFTMGRPWRPVDVPGDDEIADLAAAFNRQAEVLQRTLSDLEAHRQRLAELVQALISAQEEERKLVAYDLHDGLIQYLVAARMQLTNFTALRESSPEVAEQALRAGIDQLATAITEGRRVIEGLRPTLLDNLGLAAAVREYARQMAEVAGWMLVLDLPDDLPPLSAAVQITAYRILQEALTNVRKHARATQVWVRLAVEDNFLCGEVRDNGRGFVVREGRAEGRSVGLVGMAERARLLNGTVEVESYPDGRGTRVVVRLPLNGAEGGVV